LKDIAEKLGLTGSVSTGTDANLPDERPCHVALVRKPARSGSLGERQSGSNSPARQFNPMLNEVSVGCRPHLLCEAAQDLKAAQPRSCCIILKRKRSISLRFDALKDAHD
jgi:hypothetical protein